MRFKRSEGLTPSEKILADLCEKSFLKLWTYPNLYQRPGKELADLVVIFGRDLIIFSDKSCEFPDSGNLNIDWSRWYRKSVIASAKQASGAERWIREHPDRIFLDPACKIPIPIVIPTGVGTHIHRICVALGSANRADTETGKRSLRISTTTQNDREHFTIGRIEEAKGWIHVFDEESLSIILRELSTAADFIHYLNAKIALFDEGQFQFAECELDIMAYYLWNNRSFPPSDRPFRLEPNLWPQVEANAAFRRARVENEYSVFWDRLIEHLTNHYMEQTLEIGNELTVSDYESIARLMAGENRLFRRILSSQILERAERAKNNPIGSLLPSSQPDLNYVLYMGPGAPKLKYAEYREDRKLALHSRCIAAKAAKPDKRYIVGMALDARDVEGSSEDFILMDTAEWSVEAIAKAEELRQELGYFVKHQTIETTVHIDEYPTA